MFFSNQHSASSLNYNVSSRHLDWYLKRYLINELARCSCMQYAKADEIKFGLNYHVLVDWYSIALDMRCYLFRIRVPTKIFLHKFGQVWIIGSIAIHQFDHIYIYKTQCLCVCLSSNIEKKTKACRSF